MTFPCRMLALVAALATLWLPPHRASAMTIDVSYASSYAGTTAEQTAVAAAASYFDSAFTNTATLNFTVGFDTLTGGYDAETTVATTSGYANANSGSGTISYTSFYNALKTADPTAATLVAAPTATIGLYINNISGCTGTTTGTPSGLQTDFTQYCEQNVAASSLNMDLTTANARAIGLTGASVQGQALKAANATDFGCGGTTTNFNTTACDAVIDISSTLAATLSQAELTGLVEHEMEHALGFLSGVDTLDAATKANPIAKYLSSPGYVMPLDLFRCSGTSQSNATGDSYNVDFTVDSRTKYFSTNQCATTSNDAVFGNGANNGGTNGGTSTEQADEWSSYTALTCVSGGTVYTSTSTIPTASCSAGGAQALMNGVPSLTAPLAPTSLDIAALNAIGFVSAPVPEPASLPLLGAGILALFAATRRRLTPR